MTERECAAWLRERDGFLILTHVRPDGDTLGCAGALKLALNALGKTAWVARNPGITETYADYMTGLYAPENFVPEHIVAVDVATEGLFPSAFAQYKGKVALCIDHHPSNEFYAQETCLDAAAAACGEIIYRICTLLGVMDAEIAKQLYIAISTDCGCFAYNNTTAETHRIAAELFTWGDFWQQVNKNCFQTLSLKEIRLQNRLLESMVFYDDGATAIGAISLKDLSDLQASQGDSEELSSWANKIEGVRVAATLRQLEKRVWKLSLRTGGWLNATKVCALLGGGGHAAAAGATMRDVDEAEAREKTLAAIRAVQAEG
ncbi:MAG: DHH family phosphoesterase [Oscillospiraceae bacterium]|nr:DHH family phosphoesterase [Oscillospiraceae bacterium]